METKNYVVTDRAGQRVAGRRVKAGEELQLTPAEAAAELREGTIVEKGGTLHPAFTTDSAALQAIRERATGREPKPAQAPAAEPAPAGDAAAVDGGDKRPSKAARKAGEG